MGLNFEMCEQRLNNTKYSAILKSHKFARMFASLTSRSKSSLVKFVYLLGQSTDTKFKKTIKVTFVVYEWFVGYCG